MGRDRIDRTAREHAITDDLQRELHALQNFIGALADLATETGELEHQPAEGSDESGAVRVTLDAAGRPTTIDVDYAWSRFLDAEMLGAAVMQASTAAAQRRMEAWAAALEDHGVEERLASLGDDPFAMPAWPSEASMAPEAAATVHPRPPSELAEAALAALDAVEEADPEEPETEPTFTGFDISGQVSVSLDRTGLIDCTVYGDWAREFDGAYLSASLQEALTKALAQHDAAADAPAEKGSAEETIDGLLSEAMAMLRDPQRYLGA